MTLDAYPYIGGMAISAIGPRDVLTALRHMEARGALESVQRVKQHIGHMQRNTVRIVQGMSYQMRKDALREAFPFLEVAQHG